MRSHKTFGKLFQPHGHEHKTLKNIRRGELTEPFNCARFDLDANKLGDLKLLQALVAEELQRWKRVHKTNVEYIAIDMAEVDDDAYVLQAFLQPQGESALFTLDQGLVWNNLLKRPDLSATIVFYEDKLRHHNSVSQDIWGPITTLARHYDELRPLRAKLVYMRMKGDMTKGVIKPPVTA